MIFVNLNNSLNLSMKKSAFIYICFLLVLSASSREVININRGWSFSRGYEMSDTKATLVNLPHTWNLDALSGQLDYYRGVGSYLREIKVPKTWVDKRVYIRFKGANAVTNLFVNGRQVGEHNGGYTAFAFEITQFLKYGESNRLLVRVNNSMTLDMMPLVGNFNMYGGLYRDVELIVTDKTHISLKDNGSMGVYVEPMVVTHDFAKFNTAVLIDGVPDEVAVVEMVVRDAAGVVVDSIQRRVRISSVPMIVSNVFEISKPHLWNGVEDPYMYSMCVSSRTTDKAFDSITEGFGLRYFSVDRTNGFILNGEPYKIRGVCRHQDRSEIGAAIHPIHQQEDLDLIREVGANAIRLTYMPNDKYFLDLCDRAGIIVWSELPFSGPGFYKDEGFIDTETFKDNGIQQLVEMIRQNFNHPSIMFWGLFNELTQRGDDPVPYIRELNDLAHAEDPTRFTVAASNQDGELNFITDLMAWNQFLGWYSGLPSDISVWLQQLRRDWPTLKPAISEYGAGASIYHQSDTLARPAAESAWHPERWQTNFHEVYWANISKASFLWGTFVYSMFDFGSAYRSEGDRPGINDKGLVTFDRRVKKDAFYFYKANWNEKDKFIYIAERRWNVRRSLKQSIKVYSNYQEVELWVNGKSLGEKLGDDMHRFIWENVEMKMGENIIEARAGALYDKVTVEITSQLEL